MAKVIVQHRVADFDRWLPVFNEHEAVRRLHGATGHAIARDVTDPGSVVIINDFSSVDGARGFMADPSLPVVMQRAGVEGAPKVWLVEEAEERRY
ncbi:MAG TPA: cyclase [Candidatus Dormibacteraeota bacterium]|nr:cyclase [Candidatus Dormibacteraeota bacterium]